MSAAPTKPTVTEREARQVAEAFEEHDVRMLEDSYAVRHDQAAYIGFVRRSTEMLEQVMRADIESTVQNRRGGETTTPETDDPDLDNKAAAQSDPR